MKNETVTLSRELMTRIAHPKDCDDGYFQDIEALRAALAEPVPQYHREPLGMNDEVRQRLTLIAREAAISSPHRYSYMPAMPDEAQTWMPHAWVLEAMRMVELGTYVEPVPPAGVEQLPQRMKDQHRDDYSYVRFKEGYNAACDAWEPHVTRLQAEVERLSQALRREQNEHCTTVNARDNAEQVADEMACKIGKIFRVEIGEHSNMNCPWGIAIGVLDGEYETDSDMERERAALQAELTKARELLIPEECPHMIVFDDADRETLMFAGAGARTAALKTWEQISRSWNAHLFVRVERNSRDDRYPSAHQSAPAARDGE